MVGNNKNSHPNNDNNDDTEDFASRMSDVLNAGALNVAMAMGYKQGLFDTLDLADEQPLTCDELAHRAKVHARVCREWLGVVVCGNIVEVCTASDKHDDDDDEPRYWLPKHRANVLCRRAGRENLGIYGQEIPVLISCAYDQVQESFRAGNGIPHSTYSAFQDLMGDLANNKYRETLIQKFLPSVQDGALVQRLHQGGMRVLDVGCGRGVAVNLMAQTYPKSTFVGMDLDADAIAKAWKDSNGLNNVEFITLDCTEIAQNAQYESLFDYVTCFDSIHDCCEPEKVLRGIYFAMKPGAKFSMIDVKAESNIPANKSHPFGPMLYSISLMYCMQVAMVNNGRALGLMWGRERAVEYLKCAGFHNIQELSIPGDRFNTHYFAEK